MMMITVLQKSSHNPMDRSTAGNSITVVATRRGSGDVSALERSNY